MFKNAFQPSIYIGRRPLPTTSMAFKSNELLISVQFPAHLTDATTAVPQKKDDQCTSFRAKTVDY